MVSDKKLIRCTNCEKIIRFGDPIWINEIRDGVYCSEICYVLSHCGICVEPDDCELGDVYNEVFEDETATAACDTLTAAGCRSPEG